MKFTCFHCGQPVPDDLELTVKINGEPRSMCCHGCQAVAKTIVDNGLQDYYLHRTSMPASGQDVVPDELKKLSLYDHPDIQKSFVIENEAHIKEAVLILEGITCAACIWLNERHLKQLSGVKSAQVNYATHRARISWDESAIKLSTILAEIQLLGYNAHPYNAQTSDALRQKKRKLDLRRIAIAGLSAAQVMMLAVALYAGAAFGMETSVVQIMRYVSLGLTLPVVFYAALPFYRSAWYALRSRKLSMDVPVSIAIISAFIGSTWITFHGKGVVYFDAITMFALFLLAARFLEQGAKEKSVEAAENLLKLAPAMTIRIKDGRQEAVPVLDLELGDIILAKPGEAIAADAVVVEGESSADEALLTGESRSVPKKPGDSVIAGSINLDGPLFLQVSGVGENTVLAGIVRMLDRAQAEKPRIAQMADRVAGYFTAVLLVLTLIAGGIWLWIDPSKTFEVVLAVLVVTCPCALSIAAPAAMAAAGSHLLQRGTLLTRGHALETLAQVNHVVFDKTGTLTYGKPVLQKSVALGNVDAERCLRLAASLEQASEHPLAASFLNAVDQSALFRVEKAQNIPGKGVSGVIDGVAYTLGNITIAETRSATELGLSEGIQAGATVVWLASEKETLGAFVLSDELRTDAIELVTKLKQAGIRVSILSGDSEDAVKYFADKLAIDTYKASMRPQDKLAALQVMQKEGDVVAMIGDGVNDAPVLAGAQVSFAMGGGTQVAHASSDIVLLSEKLVEIWHAIELGRESIKVIRQNFVWAIGYNFLALPFAAMGFVPPWLASLGMSTSSLIVVLNALRLK